MQIDRPHPTSSAARPSGPWSPTTDRSRRLGRRTFVGLAVGGVGTALAACGSERPGGREAAPAPATSTTDARRGSVLLAYFSRAGENYWLGGRRDLERGNTEVLAGLIRERTGCDVHRIEAAEPYSDDYGATVRRNVEEQDADARPAMVPGGPRTLDGYGTVILASPIWNVRPPRIMATFAERHDFAGTTVLPVTTHAMSGLGTARDEYARLCAGARIGPGLAVQGERVTAAGADVDAWLRRSGLRRG